MKTLEEKIIEVQNETLKTVEEGTAWTKYATNDRWIAARAREQAEKIAEGSGE